jgi:hypothetical protein
MPIKLKKKKKKKKKEIGTVFLPFLDLKKNKLLIIHPMDGY